MPDNLHLVRCFIARVVVKRAHGPRPVLSASLLVLGLTVFSVAGWSQASGPRFELFGAGSWAYGDTDGNLYQSGDDDGSSENAGFTLTALGRPAERLTVTAQVHLDSRSQAGEDLDVLLDYAFAQWDLSDAFRLHLGRAKHPFGIYGEIFRIGTLRPFQELPQGIYGPAGMVGENYDGVSATGTTFFGSWELRYDVYVGDIEIRISRPWLSLVDPDLQSRDQISDINEVIGTRLVLETPVSGLSFGLSAYDGTQDAGGGGRIPEGAHTVYGAHLDFNSDRWWIRAELAHHDHLDALSLDGAYVELARWLPHRLQIALRYDYGEVDIDGFRPIDRAPSLWEHEDLGFALSYWPFDDLVVRLEYHEVQGNRFALPQDLPGTLAGGSLVDETSLMQLGVQFSF